MDIYHVKNAILFGFFLSFMIGPVFFMLIQTSILKGARAAIAFNLGVILGDVAFIVIAYFGSRHLLERIKDDPRLFFIGGLILIVYGTITYLDKSEKKELQASLNLSTNINYFKLIFKRILSKLYQYWSSGTMVRFNCSYWTGARYESLINFLLFYNNYC